MKPLPPALALLLLTGCAPAPSGESLCPDASTVVPVALGGGAYAAQLTARLAGPDRENSIREAIGEMHRADPTLDSSDITNILIVADCPNATRQPDDSEAADRARIAGFRAQVDNLLAPQAGADTGSLGLD